MEDKQIVYAEDLARMMGRTVRAIQMAVKRKSDSVPKGVFKVGRRLAWPHDVVARFLKGE